MINKYVTLTVSADNRTATLDNQVNVYRGDGNIAIHITLQQNVYQFGQVFARAFAFDSSIVNVDVDVVRPAKNSYFTLSSAELVDNQFTIILAKEWLDEVDEVGTYQLQINTYDSDKNKASMPSFVIEVLPRLIDSVPYARIGDEIETGILELDLEYEEVGAGQASQIKEWEHRETITVQRMNEQLHVIQQNDERINDVIQQCDELLNTTREIQQECSDAINEVKEYAVFGEVIE